ncbi:hypothetical protein HYW82_02020 [Candidatus Peregrinibacteria bacterium]|nr:hypothetical protein [Candidatus Peregrinibacteria bacterium]
MPIHYLDKGSITYSRFSRQIDSLGSRVTGMLDENDNLHARIRLVLDGQYRHYR